MKQNTGKVAKELGKKFIGYEKNKDNFEIAKRRIYGLTGKNIHERLKI